MKHLFISCAILLLFSSCGHTQVITDKQSLYFVMASSRDLLTFNEDRTINPLVNDSTLLAILYEHDNDSIITVDTLNYNWKINSKIDEFRHFDEGKWFYIDEEENVEKLNMDWDENLNYWPKSFTSVLDYSGNNFILRKAKRDTLIDEVTEGYLGGNAFYYDNTIKYTFSSSYADENKNFGRNVIDKNLKSEPINGNRFIENKYDKSEAGFFLQNNSGLPYNRKSKKLYTGYLKNTDEGWNDFNPQFPISSLDGKVYSGVSFLNKRYNSKFIVGNKDTYNNGLGITNITYFKFDKSIAKWDTISCEHPIAGMNVYKDSIAYGTIWQHPYKQRDTSLPKVDHNRYSKKYGIIPDFKQLIGRFYLWDMKHNVYNEYFSGDVDLELLLIEADKVYFREYDSIYKIDLSKMKNFSNKTNWDLVYQDKERVPNIHHIFFAKSGMKLVKEYPLQK